MTRRSKSPAVPIETVKGSPPMSETDIEAVKKKVNNAVKKWETSESKCPMCGVAKWEPCSYDAFELRKFGKGAVVFGAPTFPIYPLVCSNCGYVILLSATAIGLMDSKEEEKISGGDKS